jgi:hypothetical protein
MEARHHRPSFQANEGPDAESRQNQNEMSYTSALHFKMETRPVYSRKGVVEYSLVRASEDNEGNNATIPESLDADVIHDVEMVEILQQPSPFPHLGDVSLHVAGTEHATNVKATRNQSCCKLCKIICPVILVVLVLLLGFFLGIYLQVLPLISGLKIRIETIRMGLCSEPVSAKLLIVFRNPSTVQIQITSLLVSLRVQHKKRKAAGAQEIMQVSIKMAGFIS